MAGGDVGGRPADKRGHRVLSGATALAVGLALAAACKPKGFKPPCESPPAVQALLQISDVANLGDDGKSWPTTLIVYQLSGATRLDEPLDAATLDEQGPAFFGEELVDSRELKAYPSSREKIALSLKPNTTHLVVAARFRETIGTAWYASMAVPAGTRDDQCAAQARGDDPVMPCLYVSIERSELAGGAFAPAGFELEAFETVCAAPSSTKKKPGKKRGTPSVPDVPTTPKTPTTPTTPKTPTTPTTPRAPTTPSKPTAPHLPGEP